MNKEQSEDAIEADFEEFISRHQKFENEIGEYQRIRNIEVFASLGIFAALFLFFTVGTENNYFEKGNFPQFLVPSVNFIENFVNFIETDIIPLFDSVSLIVWAFIFISLLGIMVLSTIKRDKLGIDNRDVFRVKIAAAAVTLEEDSATEAVEDLRSAIVYGSAQRVLPKYQIEVIQSFLNNIGEIKTEDEKRQKVRIVLNELISELEEEPMEEIANINQELEKREQVDKTNGNHINTLFNILNDELISKPRRFDVVTGATIVTTFLIGYQQFALLLATLFAGARLSDYFG